jgi:xylulokinase
MTETYIIAHDLGTSGCKAAITDLKGVVLASSEKRYPVHYSPDGGAEQDPEDWWKAIVDTTHEMMAKIKIAPDQVAGMSMSSQMVGTLPVDEQGKPLRPAMIWLDARAQKEADYLVKKTGFDFIDGKAPSAKIRWIIQNELDVYAKTHKMLDCKDYLQHRMTGVFATDYTLASATTYFNPWAVQWWSDVLDAMELPVDKLPTAMAATDKVGDLTEEAAIELGLRPGIPVISGGGDVPCAVIGSGAISIGRSHLYLGTSAWIFAITDSFILDAEGIAPVVGCDRTSYALGGEMDNAGGCLKWFLENLITQEDHDAATAQGISIYQYMDKIAEEVPPGAEGLLFLPWIWGERSPVNDENVRGGFVNLGSNHTKAHMIRAILEGIGHHLRWIFSKVKAAGYPQKEVNVIGGGATSDFWLQMLADVTNVKMLQVEGPLDACARGAAMTAAVGLGFYKDFSEVEKVIRLTGKEFTPDPNLHARYNKDYNSFRYIYEPLSKVGNKTIPTVDDRKRFSLKGSLEGFIMRQWIKSQIKKAEV